MQLLLLSYRMEHTFVRLSPRVLQSVRMVRLAAHGLFLLLAVKLDLDTEDRSEQCGAGAGGGGGGGWTVPRVYKYSLVHVLASWLYTQT